MNKKLFDQIVKELSKAGPAEKDELLAGIILVIQDMLDILEKIVKGADIKSLEAKKLNKEIKEIEDTISLGIPGWIKYTRKIKKRKK